MRLLLADPVCCGGERGVTTNPLPRRALHAIERRPWAKRIALGVLQRAERNRRTPTVSVVYSPRHAL